MSIEKRNNSKASDTFTAAEILITNENQKYYNKTKITTHDVHRN